MAKMLFFNEGFTEIWAEPKWCLSLVWPGSHDFARRDRKNLEAFGKNNA